MTRVDCERHAFSFSHSHSRSRPHYCVRKWNLLVCSQTLSLFLREYPVPTLSILYRDATVEQFSITLRRSSYNGGSLIPRVTRKSARWPPRIRPKSIDTTIYPPHLRNTAAKARIIRFLVFRCRSHNKAIVKLHERLTVVDCPLAKA